MYKAKFPTSRAFAAIIFGLSIILLSAPQIHAAESDKGHIIAKICTTRDTRDACMKCCTDKSRPVDTTAMLSACDKYSTGAAIEKGQVEDLLSGDVLQKYPGVDGQIITYHSFMRYACGVQVSAVQMHGVAETLRLDFDLQKCANNCLQIESEVTLK